VTIEMLVSLGLVALLGSKKNANKIFIVVVLTYTVLPSVNDTNCNLSATHRTNIMNP
jgi:hypothetical protein